MELWFLLLMAIVLVTLIYYTVQWIILRKEKKKREQLQLNNKITYLKQQALSALINPHFIFNCMNSIQHYLNKRNNEMANTYLADFASLIRLTMEDAQEGFITLSKEIKRLRLYLSLEQLRFGEDLQYDINIDSTIRADEVKVPNMILQPYLENAIWHGIMPNYGKGKIELAFKKISDGEILITIQDNGIGYSVSKKKETGDRKRYGMTLTEERLELLKKLLGQHYKVTIRDVYSDSRVSGTKVEIIIPSAPKEELLNN